MSKPLCQATTREVQHGVITILLAFFSHMKLWRSSLQRNWKIKKPFLQKKENLWALSDELRSASLIMPAKAISLLADPAHGSTFEAGRLSQLNHACFWREWMCFSAEPHCLAVPALQLVWFLLCSRMHRSEGLCLSGDESKFQRFRLTKASLMAMWRVCIVGLHSYSVTMLVTLSQYVLAFWSKLGNVEKKKNQSPAMLERRSKSRLLNKIPIDTNF